MSTLFGFKRKILFHRNLPERKEGVLKKSFPNAFESWFTNIPCTILYKGKAFICEFSVLDSVNWIGKFKTCEEHWRAVNVDNKLDKIKLMINCKFFSY